MCLRLAMAEKTGHERTMKKFFILFTLAVLSLYALPLQAQYSGQHSEEFVRDPEQEQSMPAALPETETVTVMDIEVEPLSGLFVVGNDVNVRSGPDTKYKRIAGLIAGDHVRAVGIAIDAPWIAVSKDGETLGFVIASVLAPVVDGSLQEQFLGSYASKRKNKNGVACDYRFRFERKIKVEGANFQTADYEIRFRCASSKGASSFYAHMFLTEAPVIEKTGAHLIGLDIRSIGDGLEEFLSTRYFYDPKTGKVTFNGHSLPRFAIPPKTQKFETTSVKDALQKALEASVDSWTPLAWETLFSKSKMGTE